MLATTPIFDSVQRALGIDPMAPFTFTTPTFSMVGYKKRKQLAGDASRVLREAGLATTKGARS